MSGILITVCVVTVLCTMACALLLLSANDTAADRQNLDEQLAAIKAESERRKRMREECADLRRRSGGDHAA